nr:zinc finger BED domain-containing protein RICESLEEPER 2-like [Tanacetum cinerariifolium]
MMKRVNAFEDFSVPYTSSALARMLRKSFVNFNLEDKIISITLDNASNNTNAIGKLKFKYGLPMEGRVELLIKTISTDLKFFDDGQATKAKKWFNDSLGGTDIAKITKKWPKPDKNEHEIVKSAQKPDPKIFLCSKSQVKSKLQTQGANSGNCSKFENKRVFFCKSSPGTNVAISESGKVELEIKVQNFHHSNYCPNTFKKAISQIVGRTTRSVASSSRVSGENKMTNLLNRLKEHKNKRARSDSSLSFEYERYVHSDFITHLQYSEFAGFDVLGFWKAKELMFPVLSRMTMDLITIQATSVASEFAFSTSERVLSIRRTKLTPGSLEMCMCLKDHLETQERKQHTSALENALDFEDEILDAEVQENEPHHYPMKKSH